MWVQRRVVPLEVCCAAVWGCVFHAFLGEPVRFA